MNKYTEALIMEIVRVWCIRNRTRTVKCEIVNNQVRIKYCISRQLNVYHLKFSATKNKNIQMMKND